jgi:hypothetical protein
MTADKAWIRSLHGAIVVVCEFLDDDQISVSIDGRAEVLDLALWRSLPIWQGPLPFHQP